MPKQRINRLRPLLKEINITKNESLTANNRQKNTGSLLIKSHSTDSNQSPKIEKNPVKPPLKSTDSPINRSKAVSNWLETCVPADSSSGQAPRSQYVDRSSPHPLSNTASSRKLSQHQGTENGNSNDWNSSVCSSEWGDDICEFDHQESKKVYELFEEIEKILFDMNLPLSTGLSSDLNQTYNNSRSSDLQRVHDASVTPLQSECREWSSLFPHIRLVGMKIFKQSGQEYELVESNNNEEEIIISDYSEELSFTSDSVATSTGPSKPRKPTNPKKVNRKRVDEMMIIPLSSIPTPCIYPVIPYSESNCSSISCVYPFDSKLILPTSENVSQYLSDPRFKSVLEILAMEIYEESIKPWLDELMHKQLISSREENDRFSMNKDETTITIDDNELSRQSQAGSLYDFSSLHVNGFRDLRSFGTFLTISTKTLQHRNKSFLGDTSDGNFVRYQNFIQDFGTSYGNVRQDSASPRQSQKSRSNSANNRISGNNGVLIYQHSINSNLNRRQPAHHAGTRLLPLEVHSGSGTPVSRNSQTPIVGDDPSLVEPYSRTSNTGNLSLVLLRGKSLLNPGLLGSSRTLLSPRAGLSGLLNENVPNNLGLPPLSTVSSTPHPQASLIPRLQAPSSRLNNHYSQRSLPGRSNNQNSPLETTNITTQNVISSDLKRPQTTYLQPNKIDPSFKKTSALCNVGNFSKLNTSQTISTLMAQQQQNNPKLGIQGSGFQVQDKIPIQIFGSNQLVSTPSCWSSLGYHTKLNTNQEGEIESDNIPSNQSMNQSNRSVLNIFHKRPGRYTSLR